MNLAFKSIAAVVVFVVASSSPAASIESATFTPAGLSNPIVEALAVDSITVGGMQYDDLAGPSSVTVDKLVHYDDNGANPYSQPWLLRPQNDTHDARVTTGKAIASDARSSTAGTLTGLELRGFTGLGQMDVMFANPVNAGDDAGFFLFDHLGNDTIEFLPLDAAGDVIAGWSTGVVSDWGTALAPAAVRWYSSHQSPNYWGWSDWADEGVINQIGGMAVGLDDFSGGAGTLTGVYGVRVIDADFGNDPVAVGQYGVVPEPATMVLTLTGLAGLVRRVRRRV